MVAACATVLVEFGHRIAQALECIGILEGAMHETYALCKLVPGDLVEMRAAMLLHIFLDKLTEMILRPITPCETGETEARWQQAPVREIVDRGNSFLRARSPVTPKITIEHGPAMRGSLRSRGSRNGLTQGESPGVCVVCSVIVFIVIPGRGSGVSPVQPIAIRMCLRYANAWRICMRFTMAGVC